MPGGSTSRLQARVKALEAVQWEWSRQNEQLQGELKAAHAEVRALKQRLRSLHRILDQKATRFYLDPLRPDLGYWFVAPNGELLFRKEDQELLPLSLEEEIAASRRRRMMAG